MRTRGLDSNNATHSKILSGGSYQRHSLTNTTAALCSPVFHSRNILFHMFFSPSKAVPLVALVLRGLYLRAPFYKRRNNTEASSVSASFGPHRPPWARCSVARSLLPLSLGSIGLAFQPSHAQYLPGSLCVRLGCMRRQVTSACQGKLIYVVRNKKNVKRTADHKSEASVQRQALQWHYSWL